MLLTLSIFLPLLGAVVVACLPKQALGLIRMVSLAFTVATFIPIALMTYQYSKGHEADSAKTALTAKYEEALEAAPVGLREDMRRLLEQPAANHPGLLDFVAKDPKNPTEAEQGKLAVRATFERFAAADPGAMAAYHGAWELKLGLSSSMSDNLAFVSHSSWISLFNIHYFVGVDGLSLPLIFLTGLLWILCVVYSFNVKEGVKGYFALFLLLEMGLIGVFSALDFFLFYVFWEIVLLPMYFLIGIWGGPNRVYAAIKFFIYTLVGSVLMLVAMLALYWQNGADSFNLLTLTAMSDGFAHSFQMWIFWALFIGFAIKVPVFPFHTWLPDAHVQAPTAVSVVLAGVLLKMGGYGFFRFNFTLAPHAMSVHWVIMIIGTLGVINIIYGALCAMAQRDFKSLVAYSSVSHMGFILLGMAALTQGGVQGAVLQMVNHGVSSAMMFLIVGVLYDRAHHRDLNNFGGIGLQMPYYFGFAVIGFFASLGLPGLNGFISEVVTFLGAMDAQDFWHRYGVEGLPRWLVYCALPGVVFTAGYILWCIQRVYFGQPKKEEYKSYKDLSFREVFVLTPLAALCILLGVWPSILIDYMDSTLAVLRNYVTSGMITGG